MLILLKSCCLSDRPYVATSLQSFLALDFQLITVGITCSNLFSRKVSFQGEPLSLNSAVPILVPP